VNASSAARLQIVGAAVLFSTGGAAIKACTFTSWQVAGLRSLVAAAVLALAASVLERARLRPTWRELVVACGYAITLLCFVLSNKLTTAANAIFLQSTAPVYLAIASPLLLREPLRRSDVGVMAAIAVGLVVIVFSGQAPLATASDPALGNVVALLSGVGWAATVLGLRWLAMRDGSTMGAVVWGNVLAAAIALPIGGPPEGDAGSWAAILYLGACQIGLAYVLVTRAMPHVTALAAVLLLMLEPVLSPLWALAVHGEHPSAGSWMGGAIILGATVAKNAIDRRGAARSP